MSANKTFRFNLSERTLLRFALNEITHMARSPGRRRTAKSGSTDPKELLRHMDSLPRESEPTLNAAEILLARDALRETLQDMGCWEFRTKTGYPVDEALTLLDRLNDLVGQQSDRLDSELFLSEWFAHLVRTERIWALAMISAQIAASTLKDRLGSGNLKEDSIAARKLLGVVALQRKIALQIAEYSKSEARAYPVDTFSRLLFEIAAHHTILPLLVAAVESARSKKTGDLRAAF